VVLLGALAALIDIPLEVWESTLERLPERILSLNQQAFAAGRRIPLPA
jgi:Pyruvate/2-oxoacid:ferredoxin oxidoreductase gamma subunit